MSFVRNFTRPINGVRPFTNGNSLISIGPLDTIIFGGGIVLGTIVLVKSGTDTSLASLIAEMFVSHGTLF